MPRVEAGGHRTDWQMFTSHGNLAVERAVQAADEKVRRGLITTTSQYLRTVERAVHLAGYDEVYDTEPRNDILDHAEALDEQLGRDW